MTWDTRTIHLHYNSGLHVSTNGRAFAALLENLLEQWPEALKEFGILAHSMGGLVTRSAHHYGMTAGHRLAATFAKADLSRDAASRHSAWRGWGT